MQPRIPTPDEVLTLAAEILATQHPQADCAFVAGSLMRGQGSTTSDIDLVVLYTSLPHAYRESFLFREIPVETFVNDPETLAWFIDLDHKDGRPAMIGMLIEGTLIGPKQDIGLAFKTRASQLFDEGPPPLTKDAIQRLRYAITDLLDDLAGNPTPSERIAIGAALYPLLIDLALRGDGHWNGSGKWQARRLEQTDGTLSQQLASGFLDLFSGSQPDTLIDLAETLLAPHGGRLFAGYRSDAPVEWRLHLQSKSPA